MARGGRPDRIGTYKLRSDGAGLPEFHGLSAEVSGNRRWSKLKGKLTESGDHLWLCPAHRRVYEPDLPVVAEGGRLKRRDYFRS